MKSLNNLKMEIMKKYILNSIAVIALLISLSESMFSQTNIQGYVLEGASGTPMAGINMVVVGSATGLSTDGSGRYVYPCIAGTPVTIRVAVVGYEQIERTITPVPGTNYLGFWLNRPSVPSVTISGATTVCQGAVPPTITFTVANGVPPYRITYNIDGGPDQTLTSTAESVNIAVPTDNPGSFTYSLVSLSDMYSDVSASGSANVGVISAPAIPTITVGGSTTFCSGGSVTLTSSNGSSYLWSTGATTQSIVVTSSGSYSVRVTNSSECQSSSSEATVVTVNAIPAAPTIVSITHPTCATATGSIVISGLPGTGIWTLVRYPGETTVSGTGTSTTVTDIASGTYYYTVSIAGCVSPASANFVINPQPATPSATISDPITVCRDAPNPSITFTGVGGTPPYTFSYSVNDSSPFDVTTPDGNSSVDVDVPLETADLFDYRLWSVTDSNGCSSGYLNLGTVVTVAIATVSTDDATSITSESAGLNATINANGFIADIIFEYGLTTDYGNSVVASPGTVTGSENTNVSAVITELTANTLYHYRVVATILECSTYGEDLTFTTPCPTIAPTISVTNVLCYEQSTGSIDLSVAGGQAPYTYLWSNGSATEDLSDLAAGAYTCTVTDANGCIVNVSAEVTQPEEIIVDQTIANVTCNSCKDASVSISITGGTGGYTYAWTGPDGFTSDAEDLINLKPGSYNLTVTDANNCISESTSEVFSPFIVTNTDDDGMGSLRYAISYANGTQTVTPDTITFSIPGTGPYTIQPLTELPIISDPVVIDGYTQPGSIHATLSDPAIIMIELVENNERAFETGLYITSGNSIISGFHINGFQNGINLYENGNNIVKGNYIGANIIDYYNSNGNGIYIYSSDNLIGGVTPADRNIISGNGEGIRIENTSEGTPPGWGRNRIIGNYIGLDQTGEAPLGNDGYGITISDSPDNIIGGPTEGERNIISANNDGIVIAYPKYDNTLGNRIEGNYIGTNAKGTKIVGAQRGIRIDTRGNIIGGEKTGTGNLISGGGTGIELGSSAADNVIQGNFIGTDISGYSGLHNGIGISIEGGKNNLIGGYKEGQGNLISGNINEGILVRWHSDTSPENNIIAGNYIGTDKSGLDSLGNGVGIRFQWFTMNNIVGGIEEGAGNIIAYNHNSGIEYSSTPDPGYGNAILSNSIHSNGKLGIDLSGGDEDEYGVTKNDETGDGDTGPNNLQNFPVLKSLSFSQGNVTIKGSLNSVVGKEYTIQFFANKLGDESGYGEGQRYIGSAKITIDAPDDTLFTATFPVYSSWGDTFTATATDPEGNTSEFSKAIGGLKEQVVADADSLHYLINKDGLPKVPETSTLDIDAINAAFKTWTDITTSNVGFIGDGTTDLKYAAIDSINLVSFVDDQFDFGTGVLAVAAKTTEVDENDVQIRIVDADIIFNPYWVNDLEYNFGVGNDGLYGGYFDIQSVATHEIGHIIGLIHSGIPGSTMFFMLGTGTYVRTLANDDIAWASYRYPESNYNSTFGSISGKITYGYSPDNDPQPVAGALIKAINTDPEIKYSVHSYSDADGTYQVPGLIPGTYEVFIEPLDGDVQGFNLKPQNISSYLYDHTVYIDYPGEFYNDPDAAEELDDTRTSVTVEAGKATIGIDLITNEDTTHPQVLSVSPGDTILDFDIVKDITVKFSEAIDINTLTDETCYLEYSDGAITVKHYGDFTPVGEGTNIILFNPKSVLRYSTAYTLHLTDGVMDLKENSLVPFTSTFTTMAADSDVPEILYVIPADGADSVFVTEKIKLSFSEPMDKATVEAAFALTWDEGTPAVSHKVEGSYQWDSKSMVMTYSPLKSLSEDTEYTVTVNGTAKDLGENYLTAASFTFKTVPSSPPQIIYLGPADGETGVTVETPVVVDFSEPVNPETVNSQTFRLTAPDGSQVSGSFDFLNDNSRVVFRPDAKLSFNTIYTIELTTGIEDVSQPAVGMEVTSTTSFTTTLQITTPHIRYLEPSAGITGSVVLISGSGFDPVPANNIVTFNGIQTYVKDATLTELITTVPNGVMSGPVTVTVNGVVSDNTMHFDVIPESLDPCSDVIANTTTGTQVTHDVDIRGDCAYAYVTNPDDNSVSVVDLDPDNPGVVATIGVGKTPMNIDIDPQGTKAYVTNYNSHDVSVIDISNENGALAEVIKTIKVGIEPYGIAVTPDGKRVYVANHYSENLSIIDVDPASGGYDHVVANVSTGTGTKSVAITGECALAVVTGDFGVKIVNADPQDQDYNSVIATVSSGTKTREVDISAEAGLAIVSTEEGNLLVINLYPEGGDYSDAVVANVSTGTKVADVEISGDCMFVYVTDTQDGNVLVYKITQTGTAISDGSYFAGLTLELHDTIEVGSSPMGLAIDDKSERLFITDGDGLGRRVTEIRICCGPITPSTELSELIMIIQNLITYGGIKESQGITLIRKCNSALANIYLGKPKQAVNNLNDFINTVKDFIAGGKISRDQGDELIARAKAIIAMLKTTKSAETGLLPTDFDELANEKDLVLESGLGVIYPNPFSESVVINYEVAVCDPGSVKVLIRIFDINGRLIGTLVDLNMQPGCYTVLWDGKTNNGDQVPSGTYIIHFRAGVAEKVREIILIK